MWLALEMGARGRQQLLEPESARLAAELEEAEQGKVIDARCIQRSIIHAHICINPPTSLAALARNRSGRFRILDVLCQSWSGNRSRNRSGRSRILGVLGQNCVRKSI